MAAFLANDDEDYSNSMSYKLMKPIIFPMRCVELKDDGDLQFELKYVGMDPVDILQQLAKTAEIRSLHQNLSDEDRKGIFLRYGSTKLSSRTLALPAKRAHAIAQTAAAAGKRNFVRSPIVDKVRSRHPHHSCQIALGSLDVQRPRVTVPPLGAKVAAAAPGAHLIVPDEIPSNDVDSSDASRTPPRTSASSSFARCHRPAPFTAKSGCTKTDDSANAAAAAFCESNASSFAPCRRPAMILGREAHKTAATVSPEFATKAAADDVQPPIEQFKGLHIKSYPHRVRLMPRVHQRPAPKAEKHHDDYGDDETVEEEWVERWMRRRDGEGAASICQIMNLVKAHKALPRADQVKESYLIIRAQYLERLQHLHHHSDVANKRPIIDSIYADIIAQLHALNKVTHELSGSSGSSDCGGSSGVQELESTMTGVSSVKDYMSEWPVNHWQNPFPDEDEWQRMAVECGGGVPPKQLQHWITNARTRKWRPALVRASTQNGTYWERFCLDSLNYYHCQLQQQQQQQQLPLSHPTPQKQPRHAASIPPTDRIRTRSMSPAVINRKRPKIE